MTAANYVPADSLSAYYLNRTSNRMARHWAIDKIVHDLAAIGLIDFFEGPGPNPMALAGASTAKLWLDTDPGVTTSPGTLKRYNVGDPTNENNWIAVTPGAYLLHLGTLSPTTSVEDFATRTAAASANIASGSTYLRTAGYATVGDGGHALYKKVVSAPSFGGFQSADGAHWALIQFDNLNVRQFGATGNGSTDDTPAIQAAVNYVQALAAATLSQQAILRVPAGEYYLAGQVNISDTMVLQGDGQLSSALRRFTGVALNITADNMIIRDLYFPGSDHVSTGTNPLYLNTANNCIIERCYFQNNRISCWLTSSYGVEIIGCVFDVGALHAIYCETSAHNLMIERNGFYTFGGTTAHAIKFEVGSDNIGIKDNDFEYGGGAIALTNCNSVEIAGNYMEYQTVDALSFIGTNTGIRIESNWIALGSSDGTIISISNITGGSFKFNHVYNQTVNFDPATLVGFSVGINYHTGTGSLGARPWITPTLVNSWTQQNNYSLVSYIKEDDGRVHLRGAVLAGTAPSTMFTLPEAYRPDKILVFATASANGAGIVTVNVDGTVVATAATANNPCLDGISFQVAV